jgi:small subunit ribosomal protein S17
MVRNIGLMVSLPKKSCEDELCPFHGSLPVRGRLYIGTVESNKSSKMILFQENIID